ncbi:Acyl transferase domain-containing protein [Melghirimyces algeriensis]|uniref:Acyl transferase domain-containing protein n=2 Tax=Melghirimyces algeriensis TaxID=910412 RepID=A0A521FH03_9BACL|nr:beta-ketoacyl synthase N-terminal-like domain-containing protein [Melghirimyces algeriensis]SMO94820.1 Acyl transferase domain-containing protein [Melghirimyces algeriensis]
MTKVFRLTLPVDHPIIQHHTVYDQPLLPGLAYIDLLYQLADRLGLGHREYMLKRLSILNPLTVRADRPVPLKITFEATASHWKIRVESEYQKEQDNVVYITAELHPETVSFAEAIDLEGLQKTAARHFNIEKVYKEARRQGLVHGGAIKAQGDVYQDDHGVLMTLKVDEAHQQEADGYLFHPALMDGSAMVAGVLWEQPGQGDDLYLPLHYASFYCTAPLQTEGHVRALASSVKKVNDICTLDMAFYDDEGKQIGQLLGVTSKKIRAKGQINVAIQEEGRPSPAVKQVVTDQSKHQRKASGREASFERMLRNIFARHMNTSPSEVRTDQGYFELGLQSSQLLGVMQEVEVELAVTLSPTLLFEYATIQELSLYLAEHVALPPGWEEGEDDQESRDEEANAPALVAKAQPKGTMEEQNEDIAIIGMAGRFPGAANIAEFWANLVAGKDCITEVPPSRWDWKQFRHLTSPSGKPISRWGGFIDDVDCFDPYFFSIAPREAEILDPQERLFLEVSWECMEDAGYVPQTLATGGEINQSRPVGVFVGVMHKDYTLIGAEAAAKGMPIPLSLNYAPIANRVSYFCNFSGPSMAIDTVCSSSLVSVHLAIDSIRKGESDVALAGGVNLSLHPNKYLTYGMANMHASDGYCHSFGKGGDGYVSSDGVGVVLLKPLSQAIQDQDHIYAVIKGSSINHGGRASGITVPNPVAQGDLIASCLAGTNINPRTISYVEAHGTGTSLGDPIEIQGLIRAYRQYTSEKQYCAIGSVKSNIGHAESAAGISGLIKNALQLYHQTLVSSLHAEECNPYIRFAESPFYVQQKTECWNQPTITQGEETITLPRRAGLSSFGATGTNVHIIMEEGPVPMPQTASHQKVLVPLSAKSEERLHAYGQKLLDYLNQLEDDDCLNMADLAYTLQVGRVALEERVAFIVKDPDDFKQKLASFLTGEEKKPGIYRGHNQQKGELLSLLAEDEDGQDVVRKWQKKGKLSHIARLWVSGMDVDWNGFYPQDQPHRLSLPTYPFTRDRFWIPTVPSTTQEATFLHPLLHQNTSDFSGVRFSSRFTGRELLPSEYMVKGQPALPVTALIEMVQEAILQAGGEEIREITQVVLNEVTCLDPLPIDASPLKVHLRLFMNEKDGIHFDMTRGTHPDEPVCQGQALTRLPLEPPIVDIQALVANSQESDRDLEQPLRSAGLACGPGYQVIEQVYQGTDQLVLKIHLPPAAQQLQEHLTTHPVLLNAALQAAWVTLVDAGFQDMPLFIQSETIEYFHMDEPAWAVITPSHHTPGKWDTQLCAADGRVCVRMTGIHWVSKEGHHVKGTDVLSGSTGDEVVMVSPAYESQMDHLQRLLPKIPPPAVERIYTPKGQKEDAERLQERLQTALIQSAARTLGVQTADVDIHGHLNDYGLDPVSMQAFIAAFHQQTSLELDMDMIVEHQTIHNMVMAWVKQYKEGTLIVNDAIFS